MDVPVELSRVVITETSPHQVIFLKEKGGERNFPVLIGIHEALAIDRRWKGIEMPRPMTHDLLARVIEHMGGRLARIVINDLQQHTFIATLYIERDGAMIAVDSRPSDAIALGVAFDTPIFVAEHVFDEVLSGPVDLETQREALHGRREELAEEISRVRRRLEDQTFQANASSKDTRTLQRYLREMQSELEAIEEILRHIG